MTFRVPYRIYQKLLQWTRLLALQSYYFISMYQIFRIAKMRLQYVNCAFQGRGTNYLYLG